MEREVKIKNTQKVPRKYFVSVQFEFVRNYIGVQFVIIHYFYIAKITIDWKIVEKHGNKFVEGPERSTLFDCERTIEYSGSIEENEE